MMHAAPPVNTMATRVYVMFLHGTPAEGLEDRWALSELSSAYSSALNFYQPPVPQPYE